MTFEPQRDAALKALLEQTGESYVEDALRVVLASVAATDSPQVFAWSERGRALMDEFRSTLALTFREALGRFNSDAEQQLTQYLDIIHGENEP